MAIFRKYHFCNACMNGVVLSAFLMMACASKHRLTTFQQTRNVLWSDALDKELDSLSKQTLIPGFAVTIAGNDSILFAKGFGYADLQDKLPFTAQTIHGIASVSKTFLAVAIMKLVEDGLLNLDEPVNNILPYKIINPFYPDMPITVRHLVTHTSTLNMEFDPEDAGGSTIYLLEKNQLTDTVGTDYHKAVSYFQKGKNITLDQHIKNFTQPGAEWYVKENFLNHQPGTRFDYTNLDAAVAARIVEIKSGMSFDNFTHKHIFDPLRMRNTGWHYRDVDTLLTSKIYMPDNRKSPAKSISYPLYEMTDYPAGSLKTSIHDLSQFLLEMIRGSEGRGKLMSKSSYTTLFAPQLPDSCFSNRDRYLFNDQFSVGIFWAVSPVGYRLHNGGSVGIYSFIYFDPVTGSGAAAICNLPVNDFGKVRDIVHKYQTSIRRQ